METISYSMVWVMQEVSSYDTWQVGFALIKVSPSLPPSPSLYHDTGEDSFSNHIPLVPAISDGTLNPSTSMSAATMAGGADTMAGGSKSHVILLNIITVYSLKLLC